MKGKSFKDLSYEAWQAASKPEDQLSNSAGETDSQVEETNFWLVGAYWDNLDPADQTERFLEEGLWENGYQDRYIDEVKSMQVNDKIAIKATSTQRNDLPFDARSKTVSRMVIKAIGTIVANRNNGRTIEVEWDRDFHEKTWYFYTNRTTVWHLMTNVDYRLKKFADRLKDFVWYGKDQDYEWFCNQWWGSDGNVELIGDDTETIKQPYNIDDVIASGVFLTVNELNQILERLRSKKAMILQGVPGVGKTFIARKVAYALMGEVDLARIEMVQFHQSYSYDDFVQGYRPLPGKAGSFGLRNGIFYNFCQKAIKDLDREYVFIIDEINRGNLSQIFGELLMLIEADKRGEEYAVPLVYCADDEPRFCVPSNLYLIGLMNVADRSLAMVDYALRRRFDFMSLQPQFENPVFSQWLLERSMDNDLVNLIVERMSELNRVIREDPLLGENYQIGHSYFCPKGDDFAKLNQTWYQGIVQMEIIPLLKEYWFDNPKKAEEAGKGLSRQ